LLHGIRREIDGGVAQPLTVDEKEMKFERTENVYALAGEVISKQAP
jgi:hypothetical protein